MATYYDATNPDDLKLLPEALRDQSDLAEIAERVEAEVIAAYEVSTYEACGSGAVDTAVNKLDPAAVKVADYRYVCLRGYAVDAANADAGLAGALRKEIAFVLKHRLWQSRREVGLKFSIDSDRQRQYRENAEDQWPTGFGFWLRNYDVRPVNWVL